MTEWKKIIKDNHGFATLSGLLEMYSHLPILVASIIDGESYPKIEYVDEENWSDSVSDFSKKKYKFWAITQAIEMPKEDNGKDS